MDQPKLTASPLAHVSPCLLTPRETAQILGLTNVNTLAVWRTTNRYPGLSWVRVGRKVMYKQEDVNRFIESRTIRRA